MRSIETRLNELEKRLDPSERIAMVFVRLAHKESDLEKQKAEYFGRWSYRNPPIFLVITEYCELYDDYEEFIQIQRRKCPPGNCYTDWWRRK